MMTAIREWGASGVVWRVARAVLAFGLLWLILAGRPGEADDIALGIDAVTPASELAAALATTRTAGLVYADSVAPTAGVVTLLAGAAARGRAVSLRVPGRLPRLEVTAPAQGVAGRRIALDVTLRGRAGEPVELVVDDQRGSADTVMVTVGQGGSTTTAIGVEPTRAGSAEWMVRARDEAEEGVASTKGAESGEGATSVVGEWEAGGESVVARTWVRPESPVRVLVLSGSPSWETRYLVRALEGAGMELSVLQDLGRGRSVASSGTTRPASLDEVSAYDVVVLAGGQSAALEALVHRWVDARGGGVLLLGSGAAQGALGAWSARGTPAEGNTGALHWAGPAEIVPLPGVDLAVRRSALPAMLSAVPVAWSGDDRTGSRETYANAGWLGRGRIFTSAIESWPWAFEAGLVTEHARYWESVVEWLTGGLVDNTYLTASTGTPGVAWTGRLDGAVPETVALLRPTGDPLASPVPGAEAPANDPPAAPEMLRPHPTGASSASLRFVPTVVGPHGLGVDAARGVLVTSPETRPSWTESALAIGAAGGDILRAGDDTRPSPTPLDPGRSRRWLHFLIFAAAAVVAWTARRLTGLA